MGARTKSAGAAALWLGAMLAAGSAMAQAAPALPAAVPATESGSARLEALLDRHWAWYLADNPVLATRLGLRDHDARLADLSLAAMDRRAGEAAGFLAELEALPEAELSPGERLNALIMAQLLRRQVEANRFPQRARLFTNREGFHTGFANLPRQVPLFSRADYDSYLARLEAFPAQMDEAIATTRVAIRQRHTHACSVLDGFEQSVAEVAQPPERSRFMEPFAQRPPGVAEADWPALVLRGQQAISRRVNPAYQRFAEFFAREYRPRCTASVAARDLPQGADWYRWRAGVETTTALTPDQIHQLGLSEVARIGAEMEAVARRAGFADRQAYIEHLRTDPRHYARTPQELLSEAAWQARLADGWMPRLFGRLPRLPYTIEAIPAEIAPNTTTAYYSSGSLAAGRAGVYFLNTSKLNERPLFELPALTIHEAVPGHHHQIALAQELDLPPFRRHAAFFTGFVEGWGLYSERLGIEMGMYDTPERDMGRLSYEMWRAARLVVDTGMHWKGWTRDQAVELMLRETALSRANIEAEVNRYIAWPAQALAYKVGELKIRELRAAAEARLGTGFDIRRFHDALLEEGSVPLDVLEARMAAWLDAEAASSR